MGYYSTFHRLYPSPSYLLLRLRKLFWFFLKHLNCLYWILILPLQHHRLFQVRLCILFVCQFVFGQLLQYQCLHLCFPLRKQMHFEFHHYLFCMLRLHLMPYLLLLFDLLVFVIFVLQYHQRLYLRQLMLFQFLYNRYSVYLSYHQYFLIHHHILLNHK